MFRKKQLVEEITQAEALVRFLTPRLVHIAEACSVVVVLYGIGRAFLSFVWSVAWVRAPDRPPTSIRLNLARSLALALEFLLASDILETVITPSTEALIQLGAIAAIRTALNFFLARELEHEDSGPSPRLPEEATQNSGAIMG
jgi:uncharacterized membrane protein